VVPTPLSCKILKTHRISESLGHNSLEICSQSPRLIQVLGEPASGPPDYVRRSYYKDYVFIRLQELRDGWDRDRIMAAIEGEGIPCYAGSCSEISSETVFDGICPPGRMSVAKELGETSHMFLVHPTLSDADIVDTISAVRKLMEHASS